MPDHSSNTAPDLPSSGNPARTLAPRHRSGPPATRILLTEGSSLSARQTITALGSRGYRLDICDPNPLCIGRFSRFVQNYYRCPAAGTDPLGYLAFLLQHLKQIPYDVLLPVHEQAFLIAKIQHSLPASAAVALAEFDSFLQVQGKAAFTRLMERLSLPQPITSVVRSRSELEALDHFPCYIKTDYSTAGQGVWRVTNKEERDRVALLLEQQSLLNETHEVIVQQEAPGVLCQVQAVFMHGQILAFHCAQTRGTSVGGGHAARIGVDHPQVRKHLSVLGQALQWHGPLALDYLFDPASRSPTYIECNPRLVEPMNATLSGVNLAELTIHVALHKEEVEDPMQRRQSGIRSHSLLAILLGIADQGANHRKLLQTLGEAILGRGIFEKSKEDLTPLRRDPLSLVPLGVIAGQLLLHPDKAHSIATSAIKAYSLTATTVETIMQLDEKTIDISD